MRAVALAVLLLGAGTVLASDPAVERAVKADRANLQGTWKVEMIHGFQKESTRADLEKVRLTFDGNHIHVRTGTAAAGRRCRCRRPGPGRP
jgi:hypothetical protein